MAIAKAPNNIVNVSSVEEKPKRYHNVTTTLAVGYVSVGGRLESATGKPLDKR